VDELILGVVKLVPVPREVPPVEPEYQFIVPALADAPRVTVPVPHLDAGVVPVIVGTVVTVTATCEFVDENPSLTVT